jgi:hypothetical protein
VSPETRKLITRAFAALGPAPSYEEMELVVETLHVSGEDVEKAFADASPAERRHPRRRPPGTPEHGRGRPRRGVGRAGHDRPHYRTSADRLETCEHLEKTGGALAVAVRDN